MHIGSVTPFDPSQRAVLVKLAQEWGECEQSWDITALLARCLPSHVSITPAVAVDVQAALVGIGTPEGQVLADAIEDALTAVGL